MSLLELDGIRKSFGTVDALRGVTFALEAAELEFHDGERWVLEPGRFSLWIAPHAAAGLEGSFELS